jgi:hypothetical protein
VARLQEQLEARLSAPNETQVAMLTAERARRAAVKRANERSVFEKVFRKFDADDSGGIDPLERQCFEFGATKVPLGTGARARVLCLFACVDSSHANGRACVVACPYVCVSSPCPVLTNW